MNKILLCEGKCNPGLKGLDQLIEEAGVPPELEAKVEAPPEEILQNLHILKHTVHIPVAMNATLEGPNIWACVECGHERRF